MKKGVIVEQGSPSELRKANGEFVKIWKDQFVIRDYENAPVKVSQPLPIPNQHSKSTSNRHVKDRSGSSFRPDAPEFVPHLKQNTDSSSGQATHPHLGLGHEHDSRDTASHAQSHRAGAEKSSRNPNKRMQYKPYKKNANPAEKSETSTGIITIHSREETPTSQFDGFAGPKLTEGKTAPGLNRWQRRRQARSDPNRVIMHSSQSDTTTAKQHADGKGASTISRRVSGPGKYPSETTNPRILNANTKETQKGHDQQSRRKRNHQSRFKQNQSISEDAAQMSKVSFTSPNEDSVSRESKTSLPTTPQKENTILSREQVNPATASGLTRASSLVFVLED